MSRAESFFRSRWVEAPAGVEELDPAQLAPGFRAGGAHCGLKGGGKTDVGLLVCDAEAVSSALVLTRNAAAAAPVRVCRDAVRPRGGPRRGRQLRQRQRRDRRAGLPRRAGDARRGGRGARAGAGERRRRRDRDDRRAAADRRGPRRDRRGRRRPLGARRHGLLRGDHDHRPLAEALHAARRRRDALGPGQGRRDDRAGLRDDALLRADRRRRRRSRRRACATPSRLVRADHRRRPDEHQRHGPAAGERRRGQAAARGPARGGAAAAGARDRRRRRGRDPGRPDRGRRGRDADEAERVARAIANSPLVKTALFGRDPNWGRIAQAAGMALAGEELEELGPDRIEASELGGRRRRRPRSSSASAAASTRAHVCFSDLTHEYVRINAEYTT